MKTRYSDSIYQNKQGSKGDLIIGIFIGAAIGALAAMLFAPNSGKQTRGQIKDMAEKQKQNLKQQWDTTKEKAADLINSTKEKVGFAAEHAEDKVDQYADIAKNKADELADDTKGHIEDAKQRL